MKNKTLLLFKNNIINTYKLKAITSKKLILTIILLIYIVICLCFSLGIFMNNLIKILTKYGMQNYYITILFSMASIFAFLFSIFSAKSSLFDNKDNNLLLSLPIKRTEILTSRVLMLLIYNFFIGLLFIIPGLYIFFEKIIPTTISIISVIILTLFFAIIPTVFSCIVGYLAAVLTSKTNARSMFELLYYTLFIILYFFVINNANKILIKLLSNMKLFNIIIKTIFLPIYFIYKGVVTNNIIYILGFVVINLIILFLFIYLFNNNYFEILFRLSSHKTKSNYKIHTLKVNSIKKALFKKEVKRYFNSAIYVFNTIFGVVIIFIAAIASFIYSPDKIISMINLGISVNSSGLVFILVLFVVSLTITTNSSISIERDNFWILKMIPVRVKDIFSAKLLLNRIILIPLTILSILLFKISGFINLSEMLLLCVLTITYGLFISNFGLIANLLFPNFNASNDTIIVKQSLASFVGIMGGIIFFIIILLLSLKNKISSVESIIISIIITSVLYIISKVLLDKWGTKKFKEIG